MFVGVEFSFLLFLFGAWLHLMRDDFPVTFMCASTSFRVHMKEESTTCTTYGELLVETSSTNPQYTVENRAYFVAPNNYTLPFFLNIGMGMRPN